ncbi:MAG: ParB/RepB/Spo0J family partition protein [Ruminococcus sp.]|nr:ParB/RepB/Spo0J family partition protein [Ruminococcus sp.]
MKFPKLLDLSHPEDREQPPVLARVVEIPVSRISPNPDQPRRHFSADSLSGLAKSISQDGIVQPLTVRENGEGYTLVSGERRLRAAKLAGCRTVPCVVVHISDKRSAVVALVENIQRAELDCFEEAEAIASLIELYSMSRDEVCVRLGLAQSTVSNKLRLLRFSEEERRLIAENSLSERHARALLRLTDDSLRREALEHVIAEKLSVAQTEKYISELTSEHKRIQSYRRRSAVLGDVRLFANTVDKAVKVMKLAGVDATLDRTEHDGVIEFRITIPERTAKAVSAQSWMSPSSLNEQMPSFPTTK